MTRTVTLPDDIRATVRDGYVAHYVVVDNYRHERAAAKRCAQERHPLNPIAADTYERLIRLAARDDAVPGRPEIRADVLAVQDGIAQDDARRARAAEAVARLRAELAA